MKRGLIIAVAVALSFSAGIIAGLHWPHASGTVHFHSILAPNVQVEGRAIAAGCQSDVPVMPDGNEFSPQDIQDLQGIASKLPPGDPTRAKITAALVPHPSAGRCWVITQEQ
jgi:hypothetical protein